MADAKIDMPLDDIIKSSRNNGRNRRGRGRGRGGNQNQRFGGGMSGRITKNNNYNNNRGRGGNNRRGGRVSFNQRNDRSNNFRQQRGGRARIPGYNRRNVSGDKPTATYNPLSRDIGGAPSIQQQQQVQNQSIQRRQQGSVFNKVRTNQNITSLRRRMVAAQRALNRATKTLAAIPKLRQQRQRILQQPQKLRNIITRNRVGGGVLRKRLTNARKPLGRGGARRMFV